MFQLQLEPSLKMSRLQRRAIVCTHNRTFLISVLLALLFMSACARAPQPAQSRSKHADWHEFHGTWTATGNRNEMLLEGDRRASIADFNGSLMLAGESRPNVGFRAEAIIFNDSSTGMTGRAVWIDEHGDKVFSVLQGAQGDKKIAGTFVGGTGRYARATGSYEFSWRFVLQSDDGKMQGESVGLNGRVRVDSSVKTSDLGDPQS